MIFSRNECKRARRIPDHWYPGGASSCTACVARSCSTSCRRRRISTRRSSSVPRDVDPPLLLGGLCDIPDCDPGGEICPCPSWYLPPRILAFGETNSSEVSPVVCDGIVAAGEYNNGLVVSRAGLATWTMLGGGLNGCGSSNGCGERNSSFAS